MDPPDPPGLTGPKDASDVRPKSQDFTTRPTANPIMEPLSFPNKKKGPSALATTTDESDEENDFKSATLSPETLCLLCDETYDVQKNQNAFLVHVFEKHQLVIADVPKITNFKRYVDYWRQKFTGAASNLQNFCCVVQTNSAPTDKGLSELYFLLCDKLPEDRELREQLHKEELDYVLECQRKERRETLAVNCLFCKRKFNDNKSIIFRHMIDDHSFNIGAADNIVFFKEFLKLLQDTLDRLQCLYCEKYFKDGHSLKDHMRKKHHRQINPDNTDYDKYYIANYQELGKKWVEVKSATEQDVGTTDSDKTWDEWREEETDIVCLFCHHSTSEFKLLTDHMTAEHRFDFESVKTALPFYDQVKLINYIRRQIFQNKCPNCESEFKSRSELLEHRRLDGRHVDRLPDKQLWQQYEYFFPTYENDTFLQNLDDSSEHPETSATLVVPEDPPNITGSILSDPNIQQDLNC